MSTNEDWNGPYEPGPFTAKRAELAHEAEIYRKGLADGRKQGYAIARSELREVEWQRLTHKIFWYSLKANFIFWLFVLVGGEAGHLLGWW